MYFELTEALIDNMLFCMENQQEIFLWDLQERSVVNRSHLIFFEKDAFQNRYLPLPQWNSSNGFRLMERFAARLKNSTVQHELTAALDQGRGVFRAFKDVLNRYPEIENRWFVFKDREMKQEIIKWYNVLRDEWGMERIGGEPEETDDLVLEDFIFRVPDPADRPAVEAAHRRLFKDRLEKRQIPVDLQETPEGEPALIAETSGGDFAGFISVIRTAETLHICALEVKPEFQGLGVGEALCSRFLDSCKDAQTGSITIDLPSEAEGFSRVLLRKSFKPYAVRYYRPF
jgi:ribosomal protein S18 acetylase RimI-like enzyme